MLPLAAITGANFNKLHPQARSYLEDIATKLGILVGNSVKVDKIEVWAGSFESFFKSYTKDYMLTKMTWDGKDGYFHFLTPIPIAIELSGFMMGVPANSIKDKVQKVQFDPDLVEAFGEVSNQLWGNLNQALIGKIDKNIRLSLKGTVQLTQDGSKNSEIEDVAYVIFKSELKVADLDSQPFYLMMTHPFAKDVFDVEMDLGDVNKAQDAGFKKLTSDLDEITIDQVMMNHPVMDIHKTLKDAYQAMLDHKVDAIPLMEGDKVARVITLNNLEIIRSVFFDAPGQEERNRKILNWPLNRVSPGQKLVFVGPSEKLTSVISTMHKLNMHNIPVLDGEGKFLGMARSLDLLKKITG